MPNFSGHSKTQLATCHPDLQRVFNGVIRFFDCTIIEGHRPQARQDKLYAQGRTAPGPIVTWVRTGKHNTTPSEAVDVAPYPIDWKDTQRFHYFAGFVLGYARGLGIELRWGGDWDRDEQTADEKSRDLPHFEVVRK